MRRMLTALVEKSWLRWLSAGIVLAAGIFAIMTPDERELLERGLLVSLATALERVWFGD